MGLTPGNVEVCPTETPGFKILASTCQGVHMNKRLMRWAMDDALRLHYLGYKKEADRMLIKVIMRVVPETEHG